jgi:hypothetical protein
MTRCFKLAPVHWRRGYKDHYWDFLYQTYSGGWLDTWSKLPTTWDDLRIK